MKKILTIAALFMAAVVASAQQMPLIPVDEAIRIGTLDNGMTYYVRHNEEPKGQANFYIAQKVGSILEEDNQRGLAHFLEHMCFNGTENFPGNGVIKYCESIGVKFGNDLNAYTSIDETVYNIDNVPVAKIPSAIDSCLLILHDWAGALLLEDDDIDHERGVIHEEWRSRMNAQMRMLEVILPAIYPGNRYGERLPIGIMEVVDNFPYEAIRSYYKTWYRPDQQGIIVVGDIDVDEVEAKIISTFSSLPAAPADAPERYYVQVEDNEEPIVVLAKDKEYPYAVTYLFSKHEQYPDAYKTDLNYYVYDYALAVANLMIDARLAEMAQASDPDFVQASISDDDFFISKTKGALTGVVVCDEKQLSRGVSSVYREMLRATRNGFTASEYERARAEFLSQIETAYNQREKRQSATFCKQYVRHFIDNEPIAGIENEFAIANQYCPMIPVETVNAIYASLVGEGNLVVACMLPDKKNVEYPTSEEMKATLAAVAAEEIAPYEDKVNDEPLVKKLPKAGKIKSKEESVFGYNKYVLSNGATVYIKSTDYNKDQIQFDAYSWGGSSRYPDSPTIKSLEELASIGGLGSFSATELTKALAGKQAIVKLHVGNYSETLSGHSTPKDFETLLQLAYLQFTGLRYDQEAFDSWKTKTEAMLLNQEAQPMTSFQDTVKNTIYTGSDRIASLKSYEVASVDYAAAMKVLKERFASAKDFTFIFTGMIDEEEALPLICKYIGALPSKGKKEEFGPVTVDFNLGQNENVFERQMEVPMATNFFFDNGIVESNLKNRLSFDIALQTLSIVLLEEIREKEGGTYGIGAYGGIQDRPTKTAYMQIAYQCDPARYEYLNGRVEAIVAEFAQNGPSEENLAKVKEYLAKTHKEHLTNNSYYAGVLESYLMYDVDTITGYEETLESVTADDVKAIIAEVLAQNNHSKVVMVGVN